ncbi:response regulator [Vibrio sp. S4M6]|uniref:response regulator n=1 Tax=Vibrio sinus TaxID=2946865 RepID=UPI002029C083|nr:response regulator [Vibrio sinus]MCL9781190.1 response regulator [Vibrio sinus]
MQKAQVLIVDDEQDILKSLTRILRQQYDVTTFTSGQEALDHLQDNPIDVIISDMRMPEMDGAEFLTKAKDVCPDAIRLLLTGYSDMESTIRAVNEGGIYSYLSKPWDNEELKLTVAKVLEVLELRKEKKRLTEELTQKNAQLSQWNESLEEKVKQRTEIIQKANKKLEKLLVSRSQTFRDILAALSAIIQQATGRPQQQVERIAEYSKLIAIKMELSEKEVSHCYLASLLHEIGFIGAEVEKEPEKIDEPQTDDVAICLAPDANAELGVKIISKIHRFAPLIDIIRYQDENFDGTGGPEHLAGTDIPIGARILRVTKNYDFFVSNPSNTARLRPTSARAYLKQHTKVFYDPKVVDAFLKVLEKDVIESEIDTCVGLDELKIGAVLKQDVYHPNGQLMITAGQEINATILNRLKHIEEAVEVPIAVYV